MTCPRSCDVATPIGSAGENNSLRMVLVLAHGLTAPAHEGQIPDLERFLKHGNGEETSVIKVVRLGVWLSVSGRVFRLVQPVLSASSRADELTWTPAPQGRSRCTPVAGGGCSSSVGRLRVSSNVPSLHPSLASTRHQRKRGRNLHSCDPGSCFSW